MEAGKSKIILNLTQHAGTPEQGVLEPRDKEKIQRLLTFDFLPSGEFIIARAEALAEAAVAELFDRGPIWDINNGISVLIGGAPFLMAPLEHALLKRGLWPVYAFSVRCSVEERQPDGTVLKKASFRHAGFVLAAGVGMGEPWEPGE